MAESDPLHPMFFAQNSDSLCNDLNWYLGSLNDHKNPLSLYPKYNANLKELFDELDIQTLKKSDSFQYLVDSNHDSKDLDDLNDSDDLKGSKDVNYKRDKESIKMLQAHSKYFNNISNMCKEKRSQIEKDIIETLLIHENELSEFSIDLNYCDSTLKLVEDSLSNQFKSLELSSKNIKKLHEESKDISFGLDNRKRMVEKLQNFVNDIIITPSMIKSLCNDPINESYVVLVEDFSRKSKNINKMEKEYPAVEFSKIQIKKLELVLIRRIFDFISMEISNLTTPKVNIQMLQSSRFMSFKSLYTYMTNFPKHTQDLQRLYTYTMRKTYAHLFENYLNSLDSCFEKERCRESSCVLRIRSSVVVQKQNKTTSYYDMNSRDLILTDFNSQPILPTGLQANSLKKEVILKSYFKLLVDTCTTEYKFINSFFFNSKKVQETDVNFKNENVNPSNDSLDNNVEVKNENKETGISEKNMLKDIFSEVFEIISCNLKSYLRTGFDLVALSLIFIILRFNRKFLLYRNISFFESEMYELETLVFERLIFILRDIVSLISKTTKNPQISTILLWNPAPFVVNSSHILSVMLKLNEFTIRFNPVVTQLLETLFDFIEKSSTKLDPNKNAVFLINNLSPLMGVITTIQDKRIYSTKNFDFEDKSKRFEESLNESLNFYSNYLLTEFISDLMNIMNTEEDDVDDATPKKTLALATMALEYRNLCMEFINNYNERVLTIKNLISQSFNYNPTNLLVNTHVFKMFHDVYNKFYKIIVEMFKESPSDWLTKMPDPSEFNP